MKYLNRYFIKGGEKRSFELGVTQTLGRNRLTKIRLLRLSIKPDTHGNEIICSSWARPKQAPLHTFSLLLPIEELPSSIKEFSDKDWKEAGRLIGDGMFNWVDNDEEFERSVNKALALQFDAWKTDETSDLVQDLIDVLELQYGPHLGTRLHWRVKQGLTELIQELVSNLNVRANTPKIPTSKKKELVDGNS